MLTELTLFGFRNLNHAKISLARTNFFYGDNASGKTSILEAIYLLKYQKSFRAKSLDQLIKLGSPFFGLKFELNARQIFLEKYLDTNFKIKEKNEFLSNDALYQSLPIIEFISAHLENLITGVVEIRRRYIDDVMFHMEPNYFQLFKLYQKALLNRNHLLKSRKFDRDDFWLTELANLGEKITNIRQKELTPIFELTKFMLSTTTLADIGLDFYKGYETNLLDELLANKDADHMRATTSIGAHKCDLELTIGGVAAMYFLSRGQIKLLNLALILARAKILARDSLVILLIDDYFAELDEQCIEFFKQWTQNLDIQVLINAVKLEEFEARNFLGLPEYRVFEVREGVVREISTPTLI